MQCINQACERQDLLGLFALRREIEEIDAESHDVNQNDDFQFVDLPS